MNFTFHKTLTHTIVSSDPTKNFIELGKHILVSPSFYRWEKWELQSQ